MQKGKAEHIHVDLMLWLCYNLGTSQFLLKKHAEAEKALSKAVEINPNEGRFWNNLAAVLGELGRKDESEAAYQKAEQLGFDTKRNR